MTRILVALLFQVVLTSLSFILAHLFLDNSLQANVVALIVTASITLSVGYYVKKLINQSEAEISKLKREKWDIELTASEPITRMNTNFNQLAEKVTTIANMLGYASGYMDNLTNQTEENAKEILVASDQVAIGTSREFESIRQITAQLNMIVASIEGIASGAQDQAKSVGYATDVSSQINYAIEKITSKANIATQASAQAAEVADQGGKTIKETVEAITNIRNKVGQSAEKVEEMGLRSREIGAIVEKISDIADQTNLLALNAAIEAARAGEMGRGFSVVASEVRKLAENSVIATKEVNDLVKAIQLSAQEAALAMNMGVKEVEKGVECANQSGEALESIIATTEVAYRESKDVVKLTQEQTDLSKKLESTMASVSAVVEENAASTEEMAAGTDGIIIEMENISNISNQNNTTALKVAKLTNEIDNLVTDATASAQTLAEMASSLQNLVAPFNVNRQVTEATTERRSLNRKPTIGIILPTISNLFWKTAVKFAEKGADELGVNLVVCDSKENAELMEQHILSMVKQKVDGLLWVPYWGLGRRGLMLTRKAGIPVLFIDSYQGGLQPQSEEFPNYLAFVGPADETGAYEMGKSLLTQMPAGKDGKKYLAALDGPKGAPTAVIRRKGLDRAIKEHSEAVLVSSGHADYQTDRAESCLGELLAEYPQIQGVWAANDAMILGAISAAKKADRIPGKDIFFVGMDLDTDNIKAIRDGEQLFDIGGHWLQLGFGLSILYDYLNGFSIPKGRSIVKLMLLPLTRDKLNQFENDFPDGIPTYDFKQSSRAYNPQAPIVFFEMKYKQLS